MIYDSKAGDIINQFITFSRVFDEQRKLYPDDRRKSIQETIRLCREMDIMDESLAGEETATVMFAFADQEKEFNRALRKERKFVIENVSDEIILSYPDIDVHETQSNQRFHCSAFHVLSLPGTDSGFYSYEK